MEAQKFRDFITEGEIKPYRFVLIWYDDPEDPDDPEKQPTRLLKKAGSWVAKDLKLILMVLTPVLMMKMDKDMFTIKMVEVF